jgi:hypothetical protein
MARIFLKSLAVGIGSDSDLNGDHDMPAEQNQELRASCKSSNYDDNITANGTIRPDSNTQRGNDK